MTFDELKAKAHSLPMAPGVYIMRNKSNDVIYVGKAKKLHNRVSQYFSDLASHSPKTRAMVGNIDHFDVIVASTEFEALVLECAQIKRFKPKFNILLKDDKGYPYIRLDKKKPYPEITMASRVEKDGAVYFGPFGSRKITQDIIDSIKKILKLPLCRKKFPDDIGKSRPCLNFHMGQCDGWCGGKLSKADYLSRMAQAEDLLKGNYKKAAAAIREEMLRNAEQLNFENAALLRDRLQAVEALGQKQLVSAFAGADTDVIGFAQTYSGACFAVLHYRSGNLLDKEYSLFPAQEDVPSALSSLVKQFYIRNGCAPKSILLPMPMEDMEAFAEYLQQLYGYRVHITVPQRGDKKQLSELAQTNAREEVCRITTKEEQTNGVLNLLETMLKIPSANRIESFDISDISGTDTVAAMVVFRDGKPKKKDYRHFRIEDIVGQDDYACMKQAVFRRFRHYVQGDTGFDEKPDLLLIDGGEEHARCACEALAELNVTVPVFGMVKDNRHRTRALMTPEGEQIRIDSNQAIFSLIGNIQEETHRFAVSYHRNLRSKRLRASSLDEIPGVGPVRKQELLKHFGSIGAISDASVEELHRFVNADVAHNIYRHFHEKEEQQ